MEKMGTLEQKWGPNGDPKTEKGPHGDRVPQMGTHVGTVDIIIIEWSLWSKTYIVEDSTFLKTDMILVDQDIGFYW